MVAAALDESGADAKRREAGLLELGLRFREEQYRRQLAELDRVVRELLVAAGDEVREVEAVAVDRLLVALADEAGALFTPDARRKSDFFRDLAGAVSTCARPRT